MARAEYPENAGRFQVLTPEPLMLTYPTVWAAGSNQYSLLVVMSMTSLVGATRPCDALTIVVLFFPAMLDRSISAPLIQNIHLRSMTSIMGNGFAILVNHGNPDLSNILFILIEQATQLLARLAV